MHILGLSGMIRREYTYPESLGLAFWNQIATLGAFLIALSVLTFMVNVLRTQIRKRPLASEDPWDARTLEWMTPCPPPVYNFEEIPQVHTLVPAQAGAAPEHDDHAEAGHGIHLPSPSYWPLVSAVGLPIIAYGVLYSWWLVAAGALVALMGFMGWALEPSVAED
jgi:cytochrome c oxidase subunit 1